MFLFYSNTGGPVAAVTIRTENATLYSKRKRCIKNSYFINTLDKVCSFVLIFRNTGFLLYREKEQMTDRLLTIYMREDSTLAYEASETSREF